MTTDPILIGVPIPDTADPQDAELIARGEADILAAQHNLRVTGLRMTGMLRPTIIDGNPLDPDWPANMLLTLWEADTAPNLRVVT